MDAVVLRRCSGRREFAQMTIAAGRRPNLLAGEDLPAAPLQERSMAKRVRLTSAGLALFGEKGFERTSIEDIAARAKLAVGSFYQHFQSKRQLLLVLMDELLGKLSQLNFDSQGVTDVRAGIRQLLARAFSHDLSYLGAYRAWQEAVLSDPELLAKQRQIHKWTTTRVMRVFEFLQRLPNARENVDVTGLARAMDSFFWNLLAQASQLSKTELNQRIDSATHLIYHALISDFPPMKSVK
jgi:AcrR family transcriptional regulator